MENKFENDFKNHEKYMKIAIEYAKNNPIAPYATVLVDQEGKVKTKAVNRVQESPTFHGEIVAINEFAKLYPESNMGVLALYSTAEPCPMCQAAIYWAGIKKVVFGTSIPYLHKLFGRQIDIRAETVVKHCPDYLPTLMSGVLEEKCNSLFQKAVALKQ